MSNGRSSWCPPPYKYNSGCKNPWSKITAANIKLMKIFEILWKLPKCDPDTWNEQCCWGKKMVLADLLTAGLPQSFFPFLFGHTTACGILVPQPGIEPGPSGLEKTLILGKIEGKRRREWQRMRRLDGITNSMDMNLSKLQEKWRTEKPGVLQSMGLQRVEHDRTTER